MCEGSRKRRQKTARFGALFTQMYTFSEASRIDPIRYTLTISYVCQCAYEGFYKDVARQNIAARLFQRQLGFGGVTHGFQSSP
jgi:hypothetical protein